MGTKTSEGQRAEESKELTTCLEWSENVKSER